MVVAVAIVMVVAALVLCYFVGERVYRWRLRRELARMIANAPAETMFVAPSQEALAELLAIFDRGDL